MKIILFSFKVSDLVAILSRSFDMFCKLFPLKGYIFNRIDTFYVDSQIISITCYFLNFTKSWKWTEQQDMVINRDIKMVFSWDSEILEMNPGTEISSIEYGKIMNCWESRKKIFWTFIQLKINSSVKNSSFWYMKYTIHSRSLTD